jgi:DNA-directed RNA polymerase specialized sigma24 family protein
VSTSPERREQVAAFFAAHAHRPRRIVARHARGNDDIADDACTTAWTALVRRPDITLDSRGFSWLTTTAIHEVWQLHARRRHEIPVGTFQLTSRGHDDEDMAEPADALAVETETQALDRVHHAADLAAFKTLKPRERDALYLHGLGYRYHEICDLSRGARVNVAVLVRLDVGDMSLMEASRLPSSSAARPRARRARLQASWRQRRCSSSLSWRGRTRRRRAYASDATGSAEWRFCWSSNSQVSSSAPRRLLGFEGRLLGPVPTRIHIPARLNLAKYRRRAAAQTVAAGPSADRPGGVWLSRSGSPRWRPAARPLRRRRRRRSSARTGGRRPPTRRSRCRRR